MSRWNGTIGWYFLAKKWEENLDLELKDPEKIEVFNDINLPTIGVGPSKTGV